MDRGALPYGAVVSQPLALPGRVRLVEPSTSAQATAAAMAATLCVLRSLALPPPLARLYCAPALHPSPPNPHPLPTPNPTPHTSIHPLASPSTRPSPSRASPLRCAATAGTTLRRRLPHWLTQATPRCSRWRAVSPATQRCGRPVASAVRRQDAGSARVRREGHSELRDRSWGSGRVLVLRPAGRHNGREPGWFLRTTSLDKCLCARWADPC